MRDDASRIDNLARAAGPWLGLASGVSGTRATAAVVADRFDAMAWREAYAQSPGLQHLDHALNARHDHTHDLLADVFLALCKVRPRVRERAGMDASRLVNHAVVTAVTDSPECAELRRRTAGDPYAAARAVLAQADVLRSMLELAEAAARQAEQATKAQEAAGRAATAVGEALQEAAAAAGEAGAVPDVPAAAVTQAAASAKAASTAAQHHTGQAEAELAAIAPALRSAARGAASVADQQAEEEAELMRAWGVGPGALERMPFEERARLAERLRSGRMGRFAELIGRFRQLAAGERTRRVAGARGELVGITLGDDLSWVIPSELANLGVPALRGVFAARYAESRLMIYDSRGEEPAGKGAIVACVDCSYSMEEPGPGGVTREAWAKACALALLDQARADRRDFVGVLFSSAESVKVFRFPASRTSGFPASRTSGFPASRTSGFPASRTSDIDEVVDFVEHFFGGGTNFRVPLSAAVEVLEEEFRSEGRTHGDIVLLTDGECGVTKEWLRTWEDAKRALGFRCFGVAVGTAGVAGTAGVGAALGALCDDVRGVEDLADPGAVGDLFRVV